MGEIIENQQPEKSSGEPKRIPIIIVAPIIFVVAVLAGIVVIYFASQIDDFSDYKINIKQGEK